jgi:hypothetical protein
MNRRDERMTKRFKIAMVAVAATAVFFMTGAILCTLY